METGIAAALLVFTGVWHMTEWMMAGRNRDTLRLIPVGLLYAGLGFWLAWCPGPAPRTAAIAAVAVGLAIGHALWRQTLIRPWVIWVFLMIDVLVVVALARALMA